MTIDNSPIMVVVVAYHHLSDNIASLRFKELLSYFDKKKFEVHVIANAQNGAAECKCFDYAIHSVKGSLVRPGLLGIWDSLALVTVLIFPLLLRLRSLRHWWGAGVEVLEKLHRDAMARNQKMVVLASYSPIEALGLGAIASGKFKIPLILDFRDGFVFESLGRSGGLASLMRRILEWVLVRRASLITTVSRPIVDHFERTYKNSRPLLLPNGFDPKLATKFEASGKPISELALGEMPASKIIIGHFGRVGASDASRYDSLCRFVNAMREIPEAHRYHVLFMGELTEIELKQLHRLPCSHSELPPGPRAIAHDAMRRSDVLLLITGGSTGCATGKIFEYMASGRPICQFSGASSNEAGKILAETGTGITFTPMDTTPAVVLERFIASQGGLTRNQTEIDSYSRDKQAFKLQEMIASLDSIR